MPPVSSPGNVHDTSWLKKREKPVQPSQSRAQRPVESDVHATDRPRPYCHCARTGSSREETNTSCAADLIVVPLYPRSFGKPFSRPRVIGELLVWIGKNGSSTICCPATCSVSLRKMSGIEAMFAAA